MAITGVKSVIYGVEDFDKSVAFYEDFGLDLVDRSEASARFRLEEGSTVEIRRIDDPSLPPAHFLGPNIREVIWGVDSEEHLAELIEAVRRDREVTIDADGVAHFIDPAGYGTGLARYERRPVVNAPETPNAASAIARLNRHRKWRKRARPKTINHVVFIADDAAETTRFYRERLGFRLSDVSRGVGYFLRANGSNEHHSLFLLQRGSLPNYPRSEPEHICFGVEDIDELMIGGNYMEQRGWKRTMGPGRHRVASALFFYLEGPCGGQVEYGADSDYLDDSWVPMEWAPMFGYINWMSDRPAYFSTEIQWDVRFLEHDETAPSSN